MTAELPLTQVISVCHVHPGVTGLLDRFRSLMSRTLRSVRSIPRFTEAKVRSSSGYLHLTALALTNLAPCMQWFVELILAPSSDCFRRFADCLHHLAFGGEVLERWSGV